MPRLSCLSLLFAAVLCSQAPAQPQPQTTPAKSETDQLVDQLIENATRNRVALPSLTAHESIASKAEEVFVFQKNGDKAEATVRLIRKSPGNPEFEEIRNITTLNKKPVPPDQHPQIQFNLVNDFDDVQSFAFRVQHRDCFSFALTPHPAPTALLLSITPRPDQVSLPECRIARRGFTGTATIDPGSHQITHLEFTESEGLPKPSITESIDYAPAKVGDKTLWLPTTVDAHIIQGSMRWKWHSRYSDYHLYATTITILPTNPSP